MVFQALEKMDFALNRLREIEEFLKLLESSSSYDLIEKTIYEQMKVHIGDNIVTARRLSRHLDAPLVQKMIARQQNDSTLPGLYRRFLKLHEQNGGELQEVIDNWLRSPEGVNLKEELLLAQVGVEDSQFERYLKLVPQDQHPELWQRIDRESSLSLYLNHAKKRGMEERLLTKAVLKSFEWKEITMPGGHRFEIARTPETQIKWEAVMGENPSNFKGENRPVERVSWDNVQEYIAKLNKSLGLKNCNGTRQSAVGCYRLPTKKEWEFAARGGSEGEYSFGDDPSLLPRYAWFGDNSNGQTHPVGLKRENSYGLYDVHGNVWEWMQGPPRRRSIPWQRSRFGHEEGPSRIFSGGSWDFGVIQLRFSYPDQDFPRFGSSGIGFRLLRTL